jgi:MFS family permease
MSSFRSELGKGWRTVLGASIGLGCGIGAFTPVSSMFFRSLEHEYGWSKTASGTSLIAFPLTAAALPVIGALIDRFGVRMIAALSAVCLTACYLGLSGMTGALWQFYVLVLMLNVLGAGAGPISYTRPVAAHFVTGRGAALALALMGIALSGVILPIVLQYQIATHGWRAAYRLMSMVTFVGMLAALFCLGGQRRAAVGAIETAEGMIVSEALATSAFWILGLAIFSVTAASIGFVSQFQSLVIENGIEPATAAKLLSTLSASVFLSRLAVGRALDRANPRRVSAAVMALAALGSLMWTIHPGMGMALLGVVLLGLSIGAELDLLSFFTASCFGLRRYGAIYGWLGVFFYIGMAAGGLGFALVHDRTGSYQLATIGAAFLFLFAAGLFLTLPQGQQATTSNRAESDRSISPTLNRKEAP